MNERRYKNLLRSHRTARIETARQRLAAPTQTPLAVQRGLGLLNLRAAGSVAAPGAPLLVMDVAAAQQAFGAEGVLIQQFNEPAAGQTVFHLHFHVLPRHDGVALRPHSGKMADPALLAEHAGKIRAALEA